MKISIGRIVLYHHRDGVAPAIVTNVHKDEMVSLTVFFEGTAGQPRTAVQKGEGLHQWSWPVREAA